MRSRSRAAEHSRHRLDDLYRLGRIGHVRGIHAKLAEMAAEHPSNQAVAAHLRTLVSNFELKRYMTVIEAMRKMANETHAASARRDVILVVDDTPETLGLLTDTLDHAGFTVLIATDGQSALELLDQITPDLVLMDAVMPGLSGFESCRRLKQEKMMANAAGHLSHGAQRVRARCRGPRGRRCGLRDQAHRRGRAARAHPRASRERACRAGRRRGARCVRRFLLRRDRAGRLLWCTPKAKSFSRMRTCMAASPRSSSRLRQQTAGGACVVVLAVGERRLEIARGQLGGAGRVAVPAHGQRRCRSRKTVLQKTLAISSRESEVLLWVSRGKSNREIGEILTISPRTVDKHLAQIYTKLGWPTGRPAARPRACAKRSGDSLRGNPCRVFDGGFMASRPRLICRAWACRERGPTRSAGCAADPSTRPAHESRPTRSSTSSSPSSSARTWREDDVRPFLASASSR